ncbi:MAG: DUF3795 domain-containing protein [Ignavibacteriales bacterium]
MTVTRDHVLGSLAPCGLSCEKCFAFKDGDIPRYAGMLKEKLGNFDVFAERFVKFGMPAFENYPAFKALLEYLANGDCVGCRKGMCRLPGCGVAECHRVKKVDFCHECDEFPCKRTNFDPHLEKRWIAMNQRMKEIGPEAYYEETKNDPRYK